MLLRADVGRLPFATESLSAIHAGAAIHCWPDPSQAVWPLGLKPCQHVSLGHRRPTRHELPGSTPACWRLSACTAFAVSKEHCELFMATQLMLLGHYLVIGQEGHQNQLSPSPITHICNAFKPRKVTCLRRWQRSAAS